MPEKNLPAIESKTSENGKLTFNQRIIVIGASAGGFEAFKSIAGRF